MSNEISCFNSKKVLIFFIVVFLLLQYVFELTHTPIVRFVEVVFPIILAYILVKLLPDNRQSIIWIVKKVFLISVFYSLAFFFLWFFKTRFIFNVDPNLGFARFRTPFFGAVTFGQFFSSFPLIFLLGFNKKYKLWNLLGFVISLGFLYISGTRSSIYVIAIIMLLLIWFNRRKGFQFLIVFTVLLAIAVITLSFFDVSFERYLKTETSRTDSSLGIISVLLSDNISLFIGQGLGAFFPYEEFYILSQSGRDYGGLTSVNTFTSNSKEILVDPHSSYIWILSEMGLFGLILFFGLIKKGFFISINRLRNLNNENKIFIGLSVFCLSMIISNMVSSIFMNEPYVAAIFWFFLFALEKDNQLRFYNNLRNQS